MEGPCLITDKAVLDISRDLDGGYRQFDLSATDYCFFFCYIHHISIQSHNGEPYSFYHQYPDCSGLNGGIPLVLLLRAVPQNATKC